VLRRTYGKDHRVLHTAKLSQGFKVGPLSRTWQGAGISTASTKNGVTCSETCMATLSGHAEAMTPSDQEICVVVMVRPASCVRSSTRRPEGAPTKRTAGARAIESDARMRHHEIDTARLSTANRPSLSRSIVSAA